MCPKSSLYLDDCPGDNPASSGTVAPRTTAIPNGPEGDKHGVTFVLKMVIAGVSCLVGLTLLVVGAYFFWRRKRRRSRKESDEQSQESPLVALASIPGIYESCAPALPRDYLSMFERFPSDKKINLKHLTIDWNHPIGEGETK
uniref:Uncharacterized protein n=1 Tax=Steinernema glaseri TaxID=37863 RepID=A0A1I8A204_9BILA